MDASKITTLLEAHSEGNADVLREIMPLIYDELHRMAERRLQSERRDLTINATDLVHEAYLKLIKFDRIEWQNSRQFFAIASRVMRNILVDYAVKRKCEKRGGSRKRITLNNEELAIETELTDILAVHHALERLASLDSRMEQVVECRYFGGLTIEETAQALGVSVPTVNRDWNMARAWLNRELNQEFSGE